MCYTHMFYTHMYYTRMNYAHMYYTHMYYTHMYYTLDTRLGSRRVKTSDVSSTRCGSPPTP